MIDAYLTDEIQIIKVSYDSMGAETRTTVTEDARIEANNKVIAGRDGQETQSNYVIILKPETEMEYHYKIKIIKLNGNAFYQADKEFLPLKILRLSDFTVDTHVEVTV